MATNSIFNSKGQHMKLCLKKQKVIDWIFSLYHSFEPN